MGVVKLLGISSPQEGVSCLFRACRWRKLDIVTYLLERREAEVAPIFDDHLESAGRPQAVNGRGAEDTYRRVPNLPDASVPDGKGEEDNQLIRTWGEKPTYSFAPKAHWDIGTSLGILDFERATKPVVPLTRWEELAQVLLLSNELAFVD